MSAQTLVTKSIRLKTEDSMALAQISQNKGVSEASIMQQFVLEGIAKQRLEDAIGAYARGETDLSAAARYASVSVYQMMTEVKRRDISFPGESQKFIDGLKALVEMFGGSDTLRQTISEFEATRSA